MTALWGIVVQFLLGGLKGLLGGNTKEAATPTVNQVLQSDEATRVQTDKVAQAGVAAELTGVRDPSSLRAPDQFSRD